MMTTSKTQHNHILESQQFTRTWLEKVFFPQANLMRKAIATKGYEGSLVGKSGCLLFYEPSTRTRVSFEQAAAKLGMSFSSTENARDFSSAVKGESLIDTIRVMNALRFDTIILRHFTEGAAQEAASVSTIPVINAGDGKGQHPTQALLDIYTIYHKLGTVDGLTISFVGDLANGRTVRSLAFLLSMFKNITFNFVAPEAFQMRDDILSYLLEKKVSVRLVSRLADVSKESDVVYLTRIQKERTDKRFLKADEAHVKLTAQILESLPKNSILLHPLPRDEAFGELPEEYTNDSRVAIFEQVENGLYTRMALLKLLLA